MFGKFSAKRITNPYVEKAYSYRSDAWQALDPTRTGEELFQAVSPSGTVVVLSHVDDKYQYEPGGTWYSNTYASLTIDGERAAGGSSTENEPNGRGRGATYQELLKVVERARKSKSVEALKRRQREAAAARDREYEDYVARKKAEEAASERSRLDRM